MQSLVHIGTRSSKLAQWQTEHIAHLMRENWIQYRFETTTICTRGDEILDTPLPLVGGKGLFTAELEEALHLGKIDLAVHSLKDLPINLPSGLIIGAIPQRVNPADVLVSRYGYTLATLPIGATIGTSSHRRGAQLLHQRPDLRIVDIRGNLQARLHKAFDEKGIFDGIILAYAGLHRLELTNRVSQVLSFEDMLPAPGQGALGVQCRDDTSSRVLLQAINHHETKIAVTAERAFLEGLGGGCTMPISAYAEVHNRNLSIRGRVSSLDGHDQIEINTTALLADDPEQAVSLAYSAGTQLAQRALDQGAQNLLSILA